MARTGSRPLFPASMLLYIIRDENMFEDAVFRDESFRLSFMCVFGIFVCGRRRRCRSRFAKSRSVYVHTYTYIIHRSSL